MAINMIYNHETVPADINQNAKRCEARNTEREFKMFLKGKIKKRTGEFIFTLYQFDT